MRKIGGYLSATGTLSLITMGCCLDSPAWKTVLVLVVVSLVMIAAGVRMMQVPEVLKETGFRFEGKSTRNQKEKNREEVFKVWKETW